MKNLHLHRPEQYEIHRMLLGQGYRAINGSDNGDHVYVHYVKGENDIVAHYHRNGTHKILGDALCTVG